MTLQVSITGEPGCGKTTVSRLVAERLGVRYLSTGLIQREIANKRGITTLELNRAAESDRSIDDQIDGYTRSLRMSNEQFVIDSRLAWRFLPTSLKVFLVCPPSVAANRVVVQQRPGEQYVSHHEAADLLRERYESEKLRFLRYYGAVLDNLRNYELIVDTSFIPPSEIAELICNVAVAEAKEVQYPRVFLGPMSLLPTKDIREVAQPCLEPIREHYGQRRIIDGDIDPVEVCRVFDAWGIFDGHKRVAVSLDLNARLVPAVLRAQNDEVLRPGMTARFLLESSVTWSKLYDWEAAFDFTFSSYPQFLGTTPK